MSTEATLSLNLLPPEINILIFSKFSIKDLLISTLVCKQWKDFIENTESLWKAQCLQKAKPSHFPWRAHAIKLHGQVKYLQNAPSLENSEFNQRQDSNHYNRGVLSRGNIACSFAILGTMTTQFQVWNLENESRIGPEYFFDAETIPLNIDYPYVVTKHEGFKFLIRDLSNGLKVITRIDFPHHVNHVSMQGTSLVWSNMKTLYFLRNFINDTHYETFKELHPLYEDEINHEDNEYQTISFPILHNDLLIYGIEMGIIRVRDFKSEKLTILYDLNPLSEYSCIHENRLDRDLAQVINLVAQGNLLVSFVDFVGANIHIWNLETKTRIRIMTADPRYHLNVNIFNHIIIMPIFNIIKIWDIFNNKCIKELPEIKNANPNYLTTILYNNKIFQLSYGSSIYRIL